MKLYLDDVSVTAVLQDPSTEYAIEVKDLCKSFKKLKVLQDVSFNVPKGSIFALLGPNGAGKTTTINILSTLLPPDSGFAMILGYDSVKQGRQVRQSIGLAGQYAAVDDMLSAVDNLRLIGKLYHLSALQIKEKTEELIKRFELEHVAKRSVKTYSGGTRRRLDLAMSLMASPPVIFLDEPTTGLDPRSRFCMWNMIREVAQNGVTILLTTQYLDEAENLAEHIAILDNGTIIAKGTVSELKTSVGSASIIVSFDFDHEFRAAQEIFMDGDILADSQKKTLTMDANDGTKKLKNVIQCLEDHNITISGIALQRSTLDDVFLALTGHKSLKN